MPRMPALRTPSASRTFPGLNVHHKSICTPHSPASHPPPLSALSTKPRPSRFLAEADETDDGLGMLKWDWDGVEQQVPNAYFHIPKERRMVYLDLMRKYDCKVTFTGHWHQNCVAESQGLVTVITTAVGMQLSKDKSGMRIVRVFKDAISHAYYPFPNMPEAVSLASADEAGWTNH